MYYCRYLTYIIFISNILWSHADSRGSVVTMLGAGLQGTRFEPRQTLAFLPSPQRPNRFWGPKSLQPDGPRSSIPGIKAAGA